MTSAKLNINQKLIEVRKAVQFLKKDSQGEGFKYVSSSKAIIAVRQKLDEHGVLLVPRIKKTAISPHVTGSGKHWYFTELDMEYTWVNAEKPDDTIVATWYGQGIDSGEKGVGKALTYAEKYFILKSFNIPTDKDDPDGLPPPERDGSGGQGPTKPQAKPQAAAPSGSGKAGEKQIGCIKHKKNVTITFCDTDECDRRETCKSYLREKK